MGRYHAILFDMDGTLLDTLTDMQDAVNHVLAAYGLPCLLYTSPSPRD